MAISASYNEDVEGFRDEEYPGLKGTVYLDHGGITLYAKSAIEAFATDLTSNLYGNPHSDSRPSVLSTQRVESVRLRALRFFNADPKHFDLVFVQNTTAAIKLVAQALADKSAGSGKGAPCFWYGYHKDCHTSLVGVREMTNATNHCFVSDQEVNDWLSCPKQAIATSDKDMVGLFAYPGQSNMTGRRLPLIWCARLRNSPSGSNVFSLLDAAALATTAPLDLSDAASAPDFTTVAFYKIFGFPNLAGLIVRKGAASQLLQDRRYFGGGTVDMVVCVGDRWHAKKDPKNDAHYGLHDALEDGTLPFHNIIALDHAFDAHERLFTSMSHISSHTSYLGAYLYVGLQRLHHPNGSPLVHIYTDTTVQYGDARTTGATIALNVQRADGSLVPWQHLERCANSRSIFIRGGSLCNPGGLATYLGLTAADYHEAWKSGYRCGNATEEAAAGKTLGVVRVSLGAMSTKSDVDAFLDFLKEEFLLVAVTAATKTGDTPLEQVARTLAPLHERPLMVKKRFLTNLFVDGTVKTATHGGPSPVGSVFVDSEPLSPLYALKARFLTRVVPVEAEDGKLVRGHSPEVLDTRVGKPRKMMHKLRTLIST